MWRDSVVVVRMRPRAIPLAMITMRKSTHGFPFLSRDAYGAALGGPLGCELRYNTRTISHTVCQFCVQATRAYFTFLCLFNLVVKIANFVVGLNIIFAFRLAVFLVYICVSTKCKLSYQTLQRKTRNAYLFLTQSFCLYSHIKIKTRYPTKLQGEVRQRYILGFAWSPK